MSKFLRMMEAQSLRPEDFRKPDKPTVPDTPTAPDPPTVVDRPTVGVTATVVDAPTATKPRTRIFRARRAQEGHTLAEHTVCTLLWRLGTGDETSRVVTMGYDRIATLACINPKTAKLTLRSLEQKLAIETTAKYDSDLRVGKTYRVFSFAEIERRREAAGLIWVEKGKGVNFVSMVDKPTVVASTTVATKPRGTGGLSGTVTGGPSGPLIEVNRTRQKAGGLKITEEQRAFARSVLADPESTERDREAAEHLLRG
jgi:hypothetical protein